MEEIASALISLQELDQILTKQKIRFVKISKIIEQGGGLVKLKSNYDKIKRDNLQSQLNVSKIDSANKIILFGRSAFMSKTACKSGVLILFLFA